LRAVLGVAARLLRALAAVSGARRGTRRAALVAIVRALSRSRAVLLTILMTGAIAIAAVAGRRSTGRVLSGEVTRGVTILHRIQIAIDEILAGLIKGEVALQHVVVAQPHGVAPVQRVLEKGQGIPRVLGGIEVLLEVGDVRDKGLVVLLELQQEGLPGMRRGEADQAQELLKHLLS
jgi:hypothetical protein